MSDPAASAVLFAAVQRLKSAGLPDAATDARALLAHALQIDPSRLTLVLPDPIASDAAQRFDAGITARLARQPVAQITGQRLFWGRRFRVTQDTLDPRPETEVLVAEALAAPFTRLLDLGTGTGCILLSLLADRPMATGTGVDLSAAALMVARGNAESLGLADRAEFALSDWFSAVQGRFDLIVSNPPYISQAEMADLAPEVRNWEPARALTPGGDGLDAYRQIAARAADHLMDEGRLLLEIGPTQADAVSQMLGSAGFQCIRCLRDLDGRPRVISAHKAPNSGA